MRFAPPPGVVSRIGDGVVAHIRNLRPMDSKTLFRIAAKITEASSLTCAVLAYAGACMLFAGCPIVDWSEVSLWTASCIALALPLAYCGALAKES